MRPSRPSRRPQRARPRRSQAPAYAPPLAAEQSYAPHHPDVQIKRMGPPPSAYPEPPAAPVRRVEAPAVAQSFVPPPAEQPLRAPRMPEHRRAAAAGPEPDARAPSTDAAAPESRRRTLLERLATFGLSRAEEQVARRARAPGAALLWRPRSLRPRARPGLRPGACPGPCGLCAAPRPAFAGSRRICQAPAGAAPGRHDRRQWPRLSARRRRSSRNSRLPAPSIELTRLQDAAQEAKTRRKAGFSCHGGR